MILLFPWDMDLFYLEGDSPEAFDFWGSGQHLWQPHATLRSGALMENTMTCHDGCFFPPCLSGTWPKTAGYQITSEFPKTWGRLVYWNENKYSKGWVIWATVLCLEPCWSYWYTSLFMYLGAFVCTENFHRMNGFGLFLCTYQDCRRVTCTLFDSNWISTFCIWPDNSNRLWESAVQTIVGAYFLSLFLSLEDFDHDGLYLNEALARAIFQSLVV